MTPDGVEVVRFPYGGGTTEAFRSLLYLEQIKDGMRATTKSWAGPMGIEHYLQADHKGRLVQSLKSFLTSRTLTGTEVFGRRYSLEDLIARMLRDIRAQAEAYFGTEIRSAVVGRPVQYVGSEKEEDNDFAVARLTKALHLAGFEQVQFEMEPVGAAQYYQSRLDHDEVILIGDFGGGTSDFSLLHVGPSIRKRGRRPEDLLGNAGVGLAGDAFDAKIIRRLVSPSLGAGTNINSMGKVLPVPNWVYGKLERWHHLSFLRTRDVLNMLNSVRVQAFEPERIEALLHVITEDLGYQLHQAVQRTKCALSSAERAEFHFEIGHLEIRADVERADFEQWIADELRLIEECVDGLLKSSGVGAREVDMVFLTGGTSFVPAVRAIFESRFGADRIRSGNEFTSVASGLAMCSL